MTQSSIVGARIRERRIQAGIKQADLAQRAGISPSYLNLIEHNRRRIGGKILLRLAGALGVEIAVLTQDVAATLITALREAAAAEAADAATDARTETETETEAGGAQAELDQLEEFAERFPGWAGLITRGNTRIAALERIVDGLTDRLSHDPHLAESLHEVISVVTAIRSTAAILVDTPKLEPAWQRRFHRNVNEDAQRLADGAQALVGYLDAGPESEAMRGSPQEELDAFLIGHHFHFPELEGGPELDAEPELDAGSGTAIDAILARSRALISDAAQSIARRVLVQYAQDAAAAPYDPLVAAVTTLGPDPVAIAGQLRVSVPLAMRRIASLPEAVVGEVGFAVCDTSGALLRRRPVTGFSVPRGTSGCALWPLYHALTRPGYPIRQAVRQVGRESRDFLAYAMCEPLAPLGYDLPVVNRSYMLLVPQRDAASGGLLTPRELGVTCRICPVQACTARREPSILRSDL